MNDRRFMADLRQMNDRRFMADRRIDMLRDYLKWLATMPKTLWVMLTDWYLQAGVVTGALCTLAVMLAAGHLGGAAWWRVLGAFLSLNGALFVAWRVMLRLRREAEEDSAWRVMLRLRREAEEDSHA